GAGADLGPGERTGAGAVWPPAEPGSLRVRSPPGGRPPGTAMHPRGPHRPHDRKPRPRGLTRTDAQRRAARGRPVSAAADGAAILYGWHTVKAALENPARHIRRLYLTENAARRLAEDGTALPV